MCRVLLMMASIYMGKMYTSSAGSVFAPSQNNVMGAMKSPAGNPPGIVLLGSMASTDHCEKAAYSQVNATSWTYVHCAFPPVTSGNYSCHCYMRTDGSWNPSHQLLVDSGDMGRFPTPAPQPPSPYPKQKPCVDELDCGLNGICNASSGICNCDVPWIGPACSVLDLLPVRTNTGYHNFDIGSGKPISSWGGSVVSDDHGGYLMFASEIMGHCGIGAWTTNSRVVLARFLLLLLFVHIDISCLRGGVYILLLFLLSLHF